MRRSRVTEKRAASESGLLPLPENGGGTAGGKGGISGDLGAILELTKARITLAVTLSAATGHVLFTEKLTLELLLPTAGIFLLACGASALNQVQEARIDSRMRRTRSRPIPEGRITADWALFVALLFAGGGFYLLSCIEAHTLSVLGFAGFTLFWYNGVYTYLKRVTAFAVIPGALVGAVPPIIGWMAGGGLPLDPMIVKVAFFFFIWQIPHFWLLLLQHGREYEEAGLPTLTAVLSGEQIARITFMWIAALAATGVLVAVTGGIGFPWNLGVLLVSFWLVFRALAILLKEQSVVACLPAFTQINIYAFLVMVLLAGSRSI